MHKRIVFIMDFIFIAATTFILALVFFDFIFPRPYSVVFSVCVCFLIMLLYLAIKRKQYAATSLKSEQDSLCRDMLNELNLYTDAKRLALIDKALKLKGYKTERKKGGILLSDKKALVFVVMGFQKLLKKDIVKAYNSLENNEKAVIIADEFDSAVSNFSALFKGKIRLVDGKELYNLLKDTDCIPENTHAEYFVTEKKKANLKTLLNKKKSTSFFWFGLIFLATSYFVPIKIYYVVFGVIFMIFALVLRLFGKTADNEGNQEKEYKRL